MTTVHHETGETTPVEPPRHPPTDSFRFPPPAKRETILFLNRTRPA